MGDEASDILPHLLPEAEYVGEENIEVDRSTLKADLVYDILYTGGLPHILDVELQTEGDPDVPIHMAQYYIGLLAKHKKPVISMIVYPFETSIPEPPFREMSGNRVLLMMEYHVVLLWKMGALPFLRDHVVCIYTLLPAMKGITATMLLQALEEMKQYYSKPKLGDHLVRFQKILRRSTTISAQDRMIVEATLKTYEYDSLIDDSPKVQQSLLKGVQATIIEFVDARFPTLTELAQQRVQVIQDYEVLRRLVKQVATAPDENALRWYLDSFAA